MKQLSEMTNEALTAALHSVRRNVEPGKVLDPESALGEAEQALRAELESRQESGVIIDSDGALHDPV